MSKRFIQLNLEGQEIPLFLAAFRDLLALPEMWEFTPVYQGFLRDTAQTYGVSVQDILDTLPPPAPLEQQKAYVMSLFK